LVKALSDFLKQYSIRDFIMKQKNRVLLLFLTLSLVSVAQKRDNKNYTQNSTATNIISGSLLAGTIFAAQKAAAQHYNIKQPRFYKPSLLLSLFLAYQGAKQAKSATNTYRNNYELYNNPASLQQAHEKPVYKELLRNSNNDNVINLYKAALAAVHFPVAYLLWEAGDQAFQMRNPHLSARQLLGAKLGIAGSTALGAAGLYSAGKNIYNYMKRNKTRSF
jgi:hypothetical protein